MWASIATGMGVPIVFLVAVLATTGLSYRMGQTCLPNHENAIVTFWIWLVVFAALGFVLQVFTTGYCVWVYIKTLRRERSNPRSPSLRANLQTWANVKKLFVLQWRNILVSVFVLAGSLVFFLVFWTQDRKLGSVLNDSDDITDVKTWIICQTLSRGDKKECRKYVKGFTVKETELLIALILASVSSCFAVGMLWCAVLIVETVGRHRNLHSPLPALNGAGLARITQAPSIAIPNIPALGSPPADT